MDRLWLNHQSAISWHGTLMHLFRFGRKAAIVNIFLGETINRFSHLLIWAATVHGAITERLLGVRVGPSVCVGGPPQGAAKPDASEVRVSLAVWCWTSRPSHRLSLNSYGTQSTCTHTSLTSANRPRWWNSCSRVTWIMGVAQREVITGSSPEGRELAPSPWRL